MAQCGTGEDSRRGDSRRLCTRIKAALHFVECPLKIGSRNGPHYRLAFVADDIGLISVYDAIQAAAAIRITERLMW
jgi:hypothetical protein